MVLLYAIILAGVIPPPQPTLMESPPPLHGREERFLSDETFIPAVLGDFSRGKDFQVHEEPSPAVFDQANPAIAYLRSGAVVAAWCDERNGDYDIFCQIQGADGIPIGDNFVISDELGTSVQCSPAVAEHALGFILCWVDRREGNPDIYARLFTTAGDPVGSSFRLSDDGGGATQASPSVTVIGEGNFVVCWEDGRGGDLDIYGQICDSMGAPQGTNFRISDDSSDRSQRHPRLSSDSSGAFVAVWRDYRAGLYPVTFGQRFDRNGAPVGSNFMVCDRLPNNAQWNPSVASDPDGNVLVVFEDWRNGNYDIYGQAYDASGNPYGPNFLVSTDESGSEQSYPSISADWQGGFVVSWIDLREGGYDVYAQVLRDGTFQGGPFRVNETPLASQLYPAVASSRKGDFTIDWADSRSGTWDIYGQTFKPNGDPFGVNFRINDDKRGSSQLYPDVASTHCKRFCVSWLGARPGDYDVYTQILPKEGDPIGSSLLVNDDTSKSYQWAPSVGSCAESTFVVVWDDYRNGDWDIFGQIFRWDGSPVGQNFPVNDDPPGNEQGFCSAASSSASSFVLVWMDKRDESSSRWDVYGQRFDCEGNALGSNFKVNDDGIGNDQRSPTIACDPAGNFCAAWMDARNADYDIYGQRYDSEGDPLGGNFVVNDDGVGSVQKSPSVEFLADGSLWIAWADSRSGDYDIYAQQFDPEGMRVGNNVKVNDDPGLATQEDPSIGGARKGMLISWTDHRNGSANADVYAQRFWEGTPLGFNYRVNTDVGYSYQGQPSVSVSDQYIYHAWRDSRVSGQGYDIFAKTEAFEDQTRRVSPLKAKRVSRLHPVRRSLQGVLIDFDLGDGASAQLVIYGPDGRKIRGLYNGEATPGRHRVTWNLRDDRNRLVPPGVYFCMLRAGSIVEREKIILLR
jgi:hypothetical protein